MKLSGRHVFGSARETVWKRLGDPEVLAVALPGVRRLQVVGPDRYAISADVGVGGVKGIYHGTFALEDKRDFEGCTLVGSGRGAGGSVEVRARMTLGDGDSGTVLEYEAEAMVTGALAGVGSRMLQAASRRMATQFFDALDAHDGAVAVAPIAMEGAPAAGRVYERAPAPSGPSRAFVAGLLTGFALAVAGVLVGRATAPGGGSRRSRR